ncbi:uncharacterized protein [Tiliqua scincoides]|uniref:uncharacterized protein isoform X3 n=1 Tax=Tiliqua scincoides TaxID=71010 RepID=UPI003462E36C
MEVPGGAFQLGLSTRSPKPLGFLPERTDSSSSSASESSGEDWLIKVCCPAARHRFCRHVKSKKPSKTGAPHNLDKEDDFKESADWMPVASYQTYPGVRKQESSDLEWLIRLRCPRAEMEQRKSDLKQSFPAVPTSLSRSPSKIYRSSQSGKANASGSWLTQKDFCAQEVDRYLKHSDFLALRRREMLYKKWFESVSSPLLQKIQDKIDNQSSEEIEERKRKQLSLYLNYCNKKASSSPGAPVSVCVLLPPFHPLFVSPFPSDSSYFPSFLPPFPFSLLSVSPSKSPPMIVLPSILLPPSVPPYFFHPLPPFPPYLHSPSLFSHSPFLQLSPSEVTSSSTILPYLPPMELPYPSTPSEQSLPSQHLPTSEQPPSRDFSAYHSHNPFFLPVPPPIQTHRRYQARQKNSDSVKYP